MVPGGSCSDTAPTKGAMKAKTQNTHMLPFIFPAKRSLLPSQLKHLNPSPKPFALNPKPAKASAVAAKAKLQYSTTAPNLREGPAKDPHDIGMSSLGVFSMALYHLHGKA